MMAQIKPLDFQSGPKGFGTGTHLSQNESTWKTQGQVPDPFGPKLSRIETYECVLIPIGQPIESLGFQH